MGHPRSILCTPEIHTDLIALFDEVHAAELSFERRSEAAAPSPNRRRCHRHSSRPAKGGRADSSTRSLVTTPRMAISLSTSYCAETE